MAVWLVTGGSGFLGRHLLAALARHGGVEVLLAGRRRPDGWPGDRFVQVDLDDPSSIARMLIGRRPDVVVHLAGRTPPADPPAFYRTNTAGTVALLGALRAAGRPCRFVFAGSAAELGPVPEASLPVAEGYACRPVGPYALSKWFGSYSVKNIGGPVEGVVARIFNPIGPGMPVGQAFGRFADRLARPGPDPIRMRVGDLRARRDFVDVRDVADALIALAERGQPGTVYHVGTGSSRSVGEGLDLLIRSSGRRVEVERDPTLGASSGPLDSRADIGKIVREVGWSPKIAFEASLGDLWAEAAARRAAAVA